MSYLCRLGWLGVAAAIVQIVWKAAQKMMA